MSWVLHTCTTSAELPHKTPPGVDGAFRAQQIQTPVHRRTQQYLWLHLECRVNPLPTDRLQPSHTARYSLPLPFIAHDPLLWEIPEEKLSPPQVSATRPLPLGCSSASVTRSRILTRAGAVPSTPHPPLEAAWPLLAAQRSVSIVVDWTATAACNSHMTQGSVASAIHHRANKRGAGPRSPPVTPHASVE
eukprot:CAMPEP_0174376996 /NCGR_PEP_ID=MMETSP0811_2-20130205/120332_1 /TAXON_ID=73025 ORGANISM="Eutreptiella gymnastica-like, Strain CCMP1594" /NCGR_SAMPLE_ID=MMETSP0811_2 /ASSEMBLY_ACC=CAM_ASM_000667 /LENGTH=189 /DNA_ID=CAMNT_0015528791 /DNA_START=214 /DNA_END=781 /DNA_ORIENTATION=-